MPIYPGEDPSKCCTVPSVEQFVMVRKYRGTEHGNCSICEHRQECHQKKEAVKRALAKGENNG